MCPEIVSKQPTELEESYTSAAVDAVDKYHMIVDMIVVTSSCIFWTGTKHLISIEFECLFFY